MHCVGGIGNPTKNARSAIVRPDWSFNFRLSEVRFFKNCGAHFISSKGCFYKLKYSALRQLMDKIQFREFLQKALELETEAVFTRDGIRLEHLRNWYEQGLCLHGPGGSCNSRICYLEPNEFTYEGDPTSNGTVLVPNRSRVNRVDPIPNGSEPPGVTPVLGHTKDVRPEWVSFRGPKTSG